MQTFTEAMQKKGLKPAGLRDGSRLISFFYYPDNVFCFVGIDDKGRAWEWRKTGHRNGGKNMQTDLVYQDENLITMFLAVSSVGNGYAGNDLEKLKDSITKMTDPEIYKLEINRKNGICMGKRMKP